MPPRLRDYYTRTYRSAETLADIAHKCRELGGIRNEGYFDVVAYFENFSKENR